VDAVSWEEDTAPSKGTEMASQKQCKVVPVNTIMAYGRQRCISNLFIISTPDGGE